jgi:RES domain
MDFEKLIKDSEYKDIATLKEDISQIMLDKKYTTDIFTTFTFNDFYRARKHNNVKGDFVDETLFEFSNEKEFWNPPIEKAKMGRCNNENESLFYCSSDFITALLEIKPVIGDFITVTKFKNLYTKNKPEFRINPIGKTYLLKLPELELPFENYILDQSQYEIEDFLDKLFHQNVGDNESYKYKLSIAIAHIFLTNGTNKERAIIETDGLIYPSIIRNQKSYCFVLKSYIAHCYFTIFCIQTLEVLDLGKDYIKLKLLRNGYPEFEKIYPKDLFNVYWMKPPNESIEIINF